MRRVNQDRRVTLVRRGLAWANTYSVDACSVAVSWQWLLSRSTTGANPSVLQTVALFVGTWIVYAADHLLDARRAMTTHSVRGALRHVVYQRRHRILIVIWTLAVGGIGWIIADGWGDPLMLRCLVWFGVAMLYPICRWGGILDYRVAKAAFVAIVFAVAVNLLSGCQSGTFSSVAVTSGVVHAAAAFYVNCRFVQSIDRVESRVGTFNRSIGGRIGDGAVGLGLVVVWFSLSDREPWLPTFIASGIAILAMGILAWYQRRRCAVDDPESRAAQAASYDLILIVGGCVGAVAC